MRLLERVFAGCSRVVVTKLHGGFSGSLVLRTDSYGSGGSRDERVGRAMQAAGLGDMLACFEPGDLHALMPAVYADAAAHPEVYRHVAAGR